MQTSKINIQDIKPASYNPRIMPKDEYDKLKNSLDTYGLVDPIIIDTKHDNTIIGGHQRYQVLYDEDNTQTLQLIQLGDIGLIIKQTHIKLQDTNDQKALNLALNKITGQWDQDKLDQLLLNLTQDNYQLELTGFTTEDIQLDNTGIDQTLTNTNLTKRERERERERNHNALKDRINVPPIQTNIQPGDIYQLDNHKLICGDCTNTKTLQKLLKNTKCDIQFSSPPYNTTNNYEKSKYIQEQIMTNTEYTQFLINMTQKSLQHTKQSYINIQHLSTIKKSCIDWLHTLKDNYATSIIWHKKYTQPNHLQPNILQHDYEYIHVFNQKGNSTVGTIPDKKGNHDLITTPKQMKNKYALYHNATYPTELAETILQNFCHKTVLDMFAGTGTTLIAAEKQNKKSYNIELQPEYCQIIINRWEEYTGQKAEKIT